MKQFLITMAGVLAGLILFMVVAPILLFSVIANSASQAPATPSAVVLQIDLRNQISDQRNRMAFFAPQLSTVEIIRKLDAASRDNKVKGVFIRGATSGVDPAQGEELRTALNKFRASKKFVIAHMQNDGTEVSLPSYVAIAGSQIWVQQSGDFMPMGLLSQRMYLGGALEKFHVQAQFEAREQYKDAITQYTEKGPTGPSKEATTALLGSIYDSALASIAADRGLPVEQAKSAIESTPYTAADAIKYKMADKMGRPEDAAQAALDQAGKGAQFLEISKYTPAKSGGDTIALVSAEGEIVSGPARGPSLGGGAQISSDEISKALLDAAADNSVKAIVFRVSSPGGSAVASDQISHAVALAKQKGKKVVVSMGPYAASGGYYISAGADEIVADATTITGSIGIFGGKIVLGEALNHYAGVNFNSTLVGSPYIAMFDASAPFTPDQRKVFAALIDRGYNDFMGVVAAGRHLPLEKVHDVAKGRVWTGVQAKERGLVDDIGGLDVAIDKAKALAGLKADAKVQLKAFPSDSTAFEQFQALFGASSEAARAAVALSVFMSDDRVEQLLDMQRERAGVRAQAEPLAIR